jgi:hypothetical protein
MSEGETAWVIWSEEHGGWWPPRGRWGYTHSLLAAGRYPEESAKRIQDEANRYTEIIHEVAMPDPLRRAVSDKPAPRRRRNDPGPI